LVVALKRAELLVYVAQRFVMDEQSFVNFGQAFEDGGVSSQVLRVLAHTNEVVRLEIDEPGPARR
jgi:hypothetical protein